MPAKSKHWGSILVDRKVLRTEGIQRITLTYDQDNMMCYFFIQDGAVLAIHTHVESQIGFVVRGSVEFTKGNGDILKLNAGDSYYFASMEPHGLRALEYVELIECFAPARDEYKDE